jgi:hypothetical protein
MVVDGSLAAIVSGATPALLPGSLHDPLHGSGEAQAVGAAAEEVRGCLACP